MTRRAESLTGTAQKLEFVAQSVTMKQSFALKMDFPGSLFFVFIFFIKTVNCK